MTGAGYYRYDLTITLRAPFLLAGSDRRAFGVDLSQIRDHRDRAVIPDTHIKGVLRHAWDFTGATGALGRVPLFGYDPPQDGAVGGEIDEEVVRAQELGGRLYFYDLVDLEAHEPSRATRVSIDDETGTAREGHLLTIEQLAVPGEEVTFSGHCVAFLDSEEEADTLETYLETALSAISSLGRFKTVGYGRIVDPIVRLAEAHIPALGAAHSGTATRYSIRFTPDKPFLVDISRSDKNTLAGGTIIPGGALKGTLARKFQLAGRDPFTGKLGEVLSRMRISQAVPEQDKVAAWSWPEDAISRGGSPPERCPLPTSQSYSDERKVASFQGDWKARWGEEWSSAGHTSPELDVDVQTRTRVAIDPKRGAAEDGRLFSTRAVVPEHDGKPIDWVCEISWPGAATGPEFDLFRECLGQFESGLFTLGKSNAGFRAQVTALGPRSALTSALFYRVEIASVANVILPRHLDNEDSYAKAFDAYWRAASGGALSLAWEDNTGLSAAPGDPSSEPALFIKCGYRNDDHARQFQDPNDPLPFVVTLPGSVFYLAALKPEAASVLSGLVETGLPVPVWEGQMPRTDIPVSFQDNPFVPENGYGAIRVEEVTK